MKGLLKVLIWTALIVGIAFLIGWLFLFEAHVAEGNGMAPNLIRGDHYLVYTRAQFHRGATVLCEHPREPGTHVVGRIMAKSGDTVAIQRGQVLVNKQALRGNSEGEFILVDDADAAAPLTHQLALSEEESGMNRYRVLWPPRGRMLRMAPTEVPDGDFFLLHDNRSNSQDSRAYGTVRASGCIGRPLIIYNPGPSAGDATRGGRWFDFIK